MRVVALTLAALALGSTLAGAASAPSAVTSGLRGVVMRGPIRPVCDPNQPCDEPAPGIVLRFKQGSRLVARIKSGAGGRYRVTLRPGRYGVTTPKRGPGKGLTPQVVRVPKGRTDRINFHLDTGIR